MAATEEDDRPKKKLGHEIGQDLALLSVEELSERIALLKEEIARLERHGEKAGVALGRRSILQAIGAVFDVVRQCLRGPLNFSEKRRVYVSLSFLLHYNECPFCGHRVAPVHSV